MCQKNEKHGPGSVFHDLRDPVGRQNTETNVTISSSTLSNHKRQLDLAHRAFNHWGSTVYAGSLSPKRLRVQFLSPSVCLRVCESSTSYLININWPQVGIRIVCLSCNLSRGVTPPWPPSWAQEEHWKKMDQWREAPTEAANRLLAALIKHKWLP